ncbi:hypothetical protein [Kurthia sp. Dielmo]|uniref:hypothetical protein n=1 Tax=Kurthia sp. Dielmo TaxID=1033738 RepID=UPI00111D460A|nr:hypothetical protein [Kurthia sp. Dielmo]
MNFKLGNFLLAGSIGILIVTIADYLFYGEFSVRGLVISVVTVLIMYLLLLVFQYQKKKKNS